MWFALSATNTNDCYKFILYLDFLFVKCFFAIFFNFSKKNYSLSYFFSVMRVFCGLFLYRIFSRDFVKSCGNMWKASAILRAVAFAVLRFGSFYPFRTLAVRFSWLQSFATAPPFFVRPSWRNSLPRTLAVRRYRLNARCVLATHFAFYPFRRRLDLLRNFQNEGLTFVLLRRSAVSVPSFLAEVLSERSSFVLAPFLGFLSVLPGGSPFRTLVVRFCAVSRLSFRPSWRNFLPRTLAVRF